KYKVTGRRQLTTAPETNSLDQGDGNLGKHEKFADHPVHDVKHLGDLLAGVIFDVDAGRKSALACAAQHDHVNLRCPRTGLQHLVKLTEQTKVQNIERRAIESDNRRPVSFFRRYTHCLMTFSFPTRPNSFGKPSHSPRATCLQGMS